MNLIRVILFRRKLARIYFGFSLIPQLSKNLVVARGLEQSNYAVLPISRQR